jgi:hypothetical protein
MMKDAQAPARRPRVAFKHGAARAVLAVRGTTRND